MLNFNARQRWQIRARPALNPFLSDFNPMFVHWIRMQASTFPFGYPWLRSIAPFAGGDLQSYDLVLRTGDTYVHPQRPFPFPYRHVILALHICTLGPVGATIMICCDRSLILEGITGESFGEGLRGMCSHLHCNSLQPSRRPVHSYAERGKDPSPNYPGKLLFRDRWIGTPP